MRRTTNIRRCLEFLRDRARDGQPFTVEELAAATEWHGTNPATNISKRLSDFVRERPDGLYADVSILRVRFEDFKELFRQKQRLFADYTRCFNPVVLVFEFFLPLTREDRLREALDALFYRDTVEHRLREIGLPAVREALQLAAGAVDEAILERGYELVQEVIGGYSMSFVHGRFRADSLLPRQEAAVRDVDQGPYLMDETTAVVRFILPVPHDEVQLEPNQPYPDIANDRRPAPQSVHSIRWLFLNLFAEALTKVVRNQEEIWLLESGFQSGLYRWSRIDD